MPLNLFFCITAKFYSLFWELRRDALLTGNNRHTDSQAEEKRNEMAAGDDREKQASKQRQHWILMKPSVHGAI